jgi:hypothetical protein
MDIANLIIGSLGLVAAITAAYYAHEALVAGQEPRLTLSFSLPYFVLRNIGTTTARNIVEQNGYFPRSIPELFNFSGPVTVGHGSNSVVAATTLNASANLAHPEVIAVFEYENLSRQKFQSRFTITALQGANTVGQYTVRELSWRKIKSK